MPTIKIEAGPCPLNETLILENAEPDDMADTDWLINTDQARQILEAWKEAPREDDVIREWAYYESEYFITALTMEGETTIDNWESEGTSTYSTANMPLDLTISPANPHHS